jgi:hypothetical protein
MDDWSTDMRPGVWLVISHPGYTPRQFREVDW